MKTTSVRTHKRRTSTGLTTVHRHNRQLSEEEKFNNLLRKRYPKSSKISLKQLINFENEQDKIAILQEYINDININDKFYYLKIKKKIHNSKLPQSEKEKLLKKAKIQYSQYEELDYEIFVDNYQDNDEARDEFIDQNEKKFNKYVKDNMYQSDPEDEYEDDTEDYYEDNDLRDNFLNYNKKSYEKFLRKQYKEWKKM